MIHDFDARLRTLAGVIVRVGLNLQRGQRLLIAEPYELQGVARSAEVAVEAIRDQARRCGAAGVDVIWGDGARLREFALNNDARGFVALVCENAAKMNEYVRHGDALLFLMGSHPALMEGVPAASVAELRRVAWEHFGPIAQQLTSGATNWTCAPVASPGWARIAFSDHPREKSLELLWETLFSAFRVAAGEQESIEAWRLHLQALRNRCDELNRRSVGSVRYTGGGTDITLTLAPDHVWSTAQLTTRSGIGFVANLPTEETFTAPQKDSARGTLRACRPTSYGGAIIDGIELNFERGRVSGFSATRGEDVLERLLATDEGAGRIGEVAVVDRPPDWARGPVLNGGTRRLFHHPLLDENSTNHIALGEAYSFSARDPNSAALNRSLIHVDLPIDAEVFLT